MSKECRELSRADHPFVTGIVLSVLLTSLAACTPANNAADPQGSAVSSVQMMELNKDLENRKPEDDYRTTYEVFLYSFYDSDGDGIGDINGLIEKLDYIDESGYSQIWLMPVSPSPTYHKYDVIDYMDIDPQYGTLDDFDRLLDQCHERGINVIIDLVLNHTSSQHPWFLEAKKYLQELPADWEPSVDYCPYFEYFNFSRNAEAGYAPLEGTNWYYEARFWSEMPDLNLGSDRVRTEISDIMRFWLNRGVDGFRLDAVTSYYTGSNGENTDFLSWLIGEGKAIDKSCYFVAEGWTERETYAQYYASGIDSMFDFSFADNSGVIASVVKGSSPASRYAGAQKKEQELYASYNPAYINAPFYTNHDMARSAGYYAGDDGSRTKIAGALNLLMSGNAFVYYGEELGMKGSGKDENKRAPMYWSENAEEKGMCKGPEYMDSITMKFGSYETQKDDPLSVVNYYKQAVKIRNAFPVISHGDVIPLDDLSDDHVCVYLKEDGVNPSVLIAINLAEEEKTVDLSSQKNYSKLAAVLNTNTESIQLDGTKLTLPAFSIAVLTEN